MDQSLRNIEKIARSLQTIMAAKFTEMGLKRGQHTYVIFINENPGLSQLDLVQKMNIDKTTVTKALNQLQKQRLIIRQKNRQDQRYMETFPTSRGRAVYEQILSVEQELLETALMGFTERDQMDLKTFLVKIDKNIEKDWVRSRVYFKTGHIEVVPGDDIKALRKDFKPKPGGIYWGYFLKESLIGYIALDEQEGFLNIDELYLEEKHRGHGYDYELLQQVCLKNPQPKRITLYEGDIPMLKIVNLLEFRFSKVIPGEKTHYLFERKN
ncbi:MAG: hypothetical protein AVO33_10625 [delta proteobacterium ML8_F1]|nr:MAG: hypothetical protein AVO33_10625 [delta proteobacterium ML8_F1]